MTPLLVLKNNRIDLAKVPPKVHRNLFEFITLTWLDPLFRLGASRRLEIDDMPTINDNDTGVASLSVLKEFWEKFRLHIENPSKTPKPSLVATLAKTFWPHAVAILLMRSINVVIAIQLPLLIPQVITLLNPKTASAAIANGKVLVHSVYGMAALMFGMQIAAAILLYTSYSVDLNLFVRVRAITVGAVFEKSFRMTPKSWQKFNAGMVNTLINSDASHLQTCVGDITTLITSIAQILCALYYLSFILNKAVWVTVAGILFLWCCQLAAIPFVQRQFRLYFQADDGRTRILSEFLFGRKMIKIQATEEYYTEAIKKQRRKQLNTLSVFNALGLYGFSINALQQNIVAPITIMVFIAVYNDLTASNIFTVLGLFAALKTPIGSIAVAITSLMQSIVSYKRMLAFLTADEINPSERITHVVDDNSPTKNSIVLENATFMWDEPKQHHIYNAASTSSHKFNTPKFIDIFPLSTNPSITKKSPFFLDSLSLVIPKGKLVAVVGTIGGGRSSFFSALIGSMRKTSGSATIHGKIAYCSQDPWLMRGTIEENILFRKEESKPNLATAISASFLSRDLETMPHGLGTLVGEMGVNLSAGQRARVGLARAVAHDADVYLFDELCSGLDTHMSKQIFEETICGLLKGKTIVMAPHKLYMLPKFDMIVVLDGGRIVETGTFKNLMMNPDGYLPDIMKTHRVNPDSENFDEENASNVDSFTTNTVVMESITDYEVELQEPEDRRVGPVKRRTVWSYFSAAGNSFLVILISTQVLFIATAVFTRLLLVFWTDQAWNVTFDVYMKMYAVLSVVSVILTISTLCALFRGGFVISSVSHDHALEGVMRAPIHYYDDQPLGRVMNRLSNDVHVFDLEMIPIFIAVMVYASSAVSAFIMLLYTSPYMLIEFVFVFAAAFLIFQYYRQTNREVKRIGSILRSRLVSHVLEAINGIPTVHAYGVLLPVLGVQRFRTDKGNSAMFLFASSQYWLGLRLSLVTATIIFVVVLLSAAGAVSSTVVGLGIVAALRLADLSNGLLLILGNFEAIFNSVERLNFYAEELPSEAPPTLPTDPKDKLWPHAGAIQIKNLDVCYDNQPLHPVIKNLTLSILPGEKIGIVGHTGSGKSTLISALFRLVEPSRGTITIDGYDISKLGLKTLRSNIQVIPRMPVLQTESLRFNLDPNSQYTDDQIWSALNTVGLKEYVSTLSDKLDASVTDNFNILSVGHRQLVCLCKAILAQPKILVMEETSAAVQADVEECIQQTVTEKLSESTVIQVSHRLNNIARVDRVVVLENGRVIEADSPWLLIEKRESAFSRLVAATGTLNAATITNLAKAHYYRNS
ncbi:hypothetical protein O5D80_005177 [Batrachochytrium dendrobatidis]|nr:hypothetical protein O5D80_005177 [Batrachochytrium dendrobatidis]